MNFPKHKCGLYLEHNVHKDYYQTAAEYIKEQEERDMVGDWISEQERQKAIDTDEIWSLQWYPETPIGFHLYYASTLEALMKYVMDLT